MGLEFPARPLFFCPAVVSPNALDPQAVPVAYVLCSQQRSFLLWTKVTMPKRKEIRALLQRDRSRRVVSTREAGWEKIKIEQRPLRPATFRDRIWIFIGVFIASFFITGAGYIYLLGQAVRYQREEAATAYGELITHGFLPFICLAGGVAGVIIYVVISYADPYGTVAAEEAEARRRAEREQLLEELHGKKFPQGTEHEQAIRRLAELEQAQENAASTTHGRGQG